MRLARRNTVSKFVKSYNQITNPITIADKSGSFSDSGIYSDRIFGILPSTGVDYSCECEESPITGKYFEGTVCSKCNSPVTNKDTVLTKKGWTDLGVDTIIAPLEYIYFEKIIGKKNLKNILTLNASMNIDGIYEEKEIDVNNITQDAIMNIGHAGFKKYWKPICEFYIKTCKNPDKAIVSEHYFTILKTNEDLIFMDKFIVFSKILRPAMLVNKQLVFSEVNNNLNFIVSVANSIKSLAENERNPKIVDDLTRSIQSNVNEITDFTFDVIRGKKGYLRKALLGVRLNFSSRNVITPLAAEYKQNEVVIPYLNALEFFKFNIINYLVKAKRITVNEALIVWTHAQSNFNPYIYRIMKEIIKRNKVKALLNRPPTIGFGSIMLVEIADIYEDINDYTLGVSNNVLVFCGGDFDGDALALIPLLDRRLAEYFKCFDPRLMQIDRDTGGFFQAAHLTKDHALGLSVFTEA